MSEAKQNVQVRRVQPYPIFTNFDNQNGKAFAGNIVKLTPHGFLVELNETVVRTSEKYQVRFEIPVMGKEVEAPTHVVKTYDQFRDPTQPPVKPDGTPATGSVAVRLAEFHFVNPDGRMRDNIKKFLVAIGQVPR